MDNRHRSQHPLEAGRDDPGLDRRLRRRYSALLEGDGPISRELTLGLAGLAAGAAFFTSYALTKYEVRVFPSLGISGVDIHKPDRPTRAEMGGLAVLVALAVGAATFVLFDLALDGPPVLFVALAATVVLTGLVGVADDLVELSQRYKPLLIVGASIPLMA